eukprot:jgi/Botrbrau1/2541/Bobra.0079s0028.1
MWDEKRCAFCKGTSADATHALGVLIGPIAGDTTRDELFVHRMCALWSAEVYQTEHGTLRNVLAAVKRSKGIRCSQCSQRGASTGCRVDKCHQSYHFTCAQEAGCTFFPESFMIACPAHAPFFLNEPRQVCLPLEPGVPRRLSQGKGQSRDDQDGLPSPLRSPQYGARASKARSTTVRRSVYRPSQIVRRGPRADPQAHLAITRFALRRLRADLRAAAEQSSDDETHFARKQARRLARDRARLAPIVLVGKGQQGSARIGTAKDGAVLQNSQGAPQGLAWGGFETVGGLQSVVRQLREMVLLPLQYPDLFKHLHISPPRGILLHGEPGTGKTLLARAPCGGVRRTLPRSHHLLFPQGR